MLEGHPHNHEIVDFGTYKLAFPGNACVSSQPMAKNHLRDKYECQSYHFKAVLSLHGMTHHFLIYPNNSLYPKVALPSLNILEVLELESYPDP